STWSGHRGSISEVRTGIRAGRRSPGALGSLWIATGKAACSGSTRSSTLLSWTPGLLLSHFVPIRAGSARSGHLDSRLRSTEQRGDEHQRRVVLDRVLVRGVGAHVVDI